VPLRGRLVVRASIALAAVLTCVAGFVDTVGYVALYRVFTANMTGNTIAIALGGVEHDVATALRRGFAIPMFVLGLVTCRLLVHVGERRGWRRLAGALFALEAAMLAAFIAFGHRLPAGEAIEHDGRYYLLVALPAFAMGLQNAALGHVGPLTIRTTHVTGNLATLGDCAAKYLIWLRRRWRAASLRIALVESREQRAFRRTVLLAALWACYLAGALGGAYFYSRVRLLALIAPVAALVSLVALDSVRPIFSTPKTR
jgi:uncharacterized membrane protein YoaK (UPF0700 family)